MAKITPAYILFMTAIAACAACSTDGCLNNQNSLPLAGFYSSATHQPIVIDSIDIGGVDAPHDSLLHTTGTTVSEIYLPFRSAKQTTSFYFHYTQKSLDNPIFNDTLFFRYDSEPYFASEECGAMYRFIIKEVRHTSHIIDSVAITDSVITNTDAQRIQIFMRTQQDNQPSEP